MGSKMTGRQECPGPDRSPSRDQVPGHGEGRTRGTIHYLTDDEVVEIVERGRFTREPEFVLRFRVRVWNAADAPPVVLVTSVADCGPTYWATTRTANFVWRTFLRYHRHGMPRYYQADRRSDGSFALQQVAFEWVGRCGPRAFILSSRPKPARWLDLVRILATGCEPD